MHQIRLLIALVALGILIHTSPAAAQMTGGPPDGPHAQAPQSPTTKVAPAAIGSAAQQTLIASARITLGLWMPSLLSTGSQATLPRRNEY